MSRRRGRIEPILMSLPLTTRFEYCHEPEEPQRCAAHTRVIVPREEEEGLDRAEGKVEPADGTNGDPGRGRHRRGASCSVVDCTEEARRSRAPERDVARRCAQRNEQREETEEERKLRAPAGRCRRQSPACHNARPCSAGAGDHNALRRCEKLLGERP